MYYPVEMQLSSSNSSSSCSTLDSQSPRWIPNQPNQTFVAELEQQPVATMINVLDLMCHNPELVQHQWQVLSNPYNVCNILRCDPNARTRLTIYFQWLEESTKNFVWTLTESISHFVSSQPELCDGHLLGFRCMLKLGTFLMEAGWYAESIIVLNIAKGQARGRSLKVLQVLKVLVHAKSLSKRHEVALLEISEIQAIVTVTKVLPISLTVDLHCALAVCYFENCNFNASYREALLALHLLSEDACPIDTIIGTFRLMGRSCLATKKFYLAKLLITQAVSWAWHNFGSKSVIYAEALEDYAFYLLMMNAYDDAVKVAIDAKNIYFETFGQLGVQGETAQGNLPFQLFLGSYRYREQKSLDQYMECAIDLADNSRTLDLSRSDDRQTLAVRRMRPLIAVRKICDVRNAMVPKDKLENVQPQMTVKIVRKSFFTHLLFNSC